MDDILQPEGSDVAGSLHDESRHEGDHTTLGIFMPIYKIRQPCSIGINGGFITTAPRRTETMQKLSDLGLVYEVNKFFWGMMLENSTGGFQVHATRDGVESLKQIQPLEFQMQVSVLVTLEFEIISLASSSLAGVDRIQQRRFVSCHVSLAFEGMKDIIQRDQFLVVVIIHMEATTRSAIDHGSHDDLSTKFNTGILLVRLVIGAAVSRMGTQEIVNLMDGFLREIV